MGIRSEMKDWSMAIGQGWPIPTEMKAEIVERCLEMIRNPRTRERERCRAIEIMGKLDKLNIERMALEQTRVSVRLSAPYHELTAEKNDEIVGSIVSGMIGDESTKPPED